jgi:hypothetical protein
VSDPSSWSRWGPPERPTEHSSRGTLGPSSVGQLIQIGARIIRRHWIPLIVSFALFAGVAVILGELASIHFGSVLNSMIDIDASGRATFVGTEADTSRLLQAAAISTAVSVLVSWSIAVASVAAGAYVDADYHGRRTSFREAMHLALRRAPVALPAAILSSLIVAAIAGVMVLGMLAAVGLFQPAPGGTGGFGVLLALIAAVAGVLALVVVTLRLSVVFAVVAMEPVGPLHALRRSWHLTMENTWRTFGLSVVVIFVVTVLGALVSEIVSLAALSVGSEEVPVALIVGTLTTLAFAPVLPVILAALYYDLRVRRDRLVLSHHPDQ